MTIEQLQSMSDTELNELAAVKVMGSLYQNGKRWLDNPLRLIGDWNPTGDMNDAMELVTLIAPNFARIEMVAVDGLFVCNVFEDDIKLLHSVEGERLPRAITISSILAKEEE